MDGNLSYYMQEVLKNEVGASPLAIQNLQNEFRFEFPAGYIDFMTEFDGGEGEVGENSWICLFPIDDLSLCNRVYFRLLMDEIPDYFLFGKDCADTGYAFHKQMKTFHSFGLMSNFETDFIDFCGNNFMEFIEYLYNEQ